jgi:hypothetical protein
LLDSGSSVASAVEPLEQISDHLGGIRLVEKVVVKTGVDSQGFVVGSRSFKKELTAAKGANSVGSAVEYEKRGDQEVCTHAKLAASAKDFIPRAERDPIVNYKGIGQEICHYLGILGKALSTKSDHPSPRQQHGSNGSQSTQKGENPADDHGGSRQDKPAGSTRILGRPKSGDQAPHAMTQEKKG